MSLDAILDPVTSRTNQCAVTANFNQLTPFYAQSCYVFSLHRLYVIMVAKTYAPKAHERMHSRSNKQLSCFVGGGTVK